MNSSLSEFSDRNNEPAPERAVTDWPPSYQRYLWGLSGCYFVWFLWSFANSSFSLDETITAWVTSSDLETCIQRAYDFQGQSPLYFSLLWLFRQLLGGSAFALRIPSLLAVAGSVIVFRAILKQSGLQKNLWVGTLYVSFVLLTDYSGALSARPYAMAIFGSLISLYFLLRFIESRSWPTGIAYAAATSFTIILHYLFATMVVLHLIIIWKYARKQTKFLRCWVGAMSAVGLSLLPFLPHLLAVSEKTKRYEFSNAPTLINTLGRIINEQSLLQLCLVVIALGFLKPRWNFRSVDKQKAFWGITWWCIGPLSVLLLYYVTGVSLNVPRYYAWRFPALGLLVICLLEAISAHRLVALPVMLFVGCMLPTIVHQDRSGWREAVTWGRDYNSRVQSCQPVLYSGLIETASPEWLDAPRFGDYLRAPIQQYGMTDEAYLIPARVPGSVDFFEQKMEELLSSEKRLIFYLGTSLNATENVKRICLDNDYKILEDRKFQFVEVIVVEK